MKLKLAISTLLLTVLGVQAQQKKWTLRECVEYARENNLTILQAEMDLENAKIDRSDAIGDMLPSLNAFASVSANNGLSQNPTTNTLVNQTITSVTGGLRSGVRLFDGLRNIHRLNRAKLSAEAAQYKADGMRDDISLMVANNFLQILSNKETLKVLQAQLDVTQQNLERAREQVANGALPEGDLLEVEATAAGQQQQIIAAENDVFLSKIALAQLLQLTDYRNFDIAVEEFDVPVSSIMERSPEEIYEKALTVLNNVKLSQANVDLAEKDVTIAKSERYPTLDAFLNYNTRFADNTDLAFVDQLWFFDGLSYGLQLNIPIFNNFGVTNNIKRRKIGLDQQKLQLDQDKLELAGDVSRAYAAVMTGAKSYESANKAVEARRLAYQYAKERFDVGLMNTFDYGVAQARLDNAEAELIRAKYNYIFRIKVLEFYFGIPLDEI